MTLASVLRDCILTKHVKLASQAAGGLTASTKSATAADIRKKWHTNFQRNSEIAQKSLRIFTGTTALCIKCTKYLPREGQFQWNKVRVAIISFEIY